MTMSVRQPNVLFSIFFLACLPSVRRKAPVIETFLIFSSASTPSCSFPPCRFSDSLRHIDSVLITASWTLPPVFTCPLSSPRSLHFPFAHSLLDMIRSPMVYLPFCVAPEEQTLPDIESPSDGAAFFLPMSKPLPWKPSPRIS